MFLSLTLILLSEREVLWKAMSTAHSLSLFVHHSIILDNPPEFI